MCMLTRYIFFTKGIIFHIFSDSFPDAPLNVDRFSHSESGYVFFFMMCGDVFFNVFSGDRCIVFGEVVAFDSSVL